MKKTACKFWMILFVFSLTANVSFAQTETFDIVKFTTPKGWQKEVKPNAVQFGIEDAAKGTFCLMMLFKSLPAGADSKKNFDVSWDSIVKDSLKNVTKPQMQPTTNENGWNIEGGVAQYEKQGAKGAAMLVSTTGGGKVINLLVLTNSESYQAEILKFIDSIDLPKVESKESPKVESKESPNTAQLPVNNEFMKYEWSKSQNRKHPGTGDNAGYSRNTYRFGSDGKYMFSTENFQYYTPKYYLEKEEGTYRINGNRIIIKPSKSSFSVHQLKKEDAPSKTGNIALETAEYIFELTVVNNSPSLILSPVSTRETKRDGKFNFINNGAETKSYIFGARINGNVVYK